MYRWDTGGLGHRSRLATLFRHLRVSDQQIYVIIVFVRVFPIRCDLDNSMSSEFISQW